MKTNLFLVGVILSIFFSFNVSNCVKRAVEPKTSSCKAKRQKTEVQENCQLQEDDDEDGQEADAIQKYINSSPTPIRIGLNRAATLVKLENIEEAMAIYEKLIDEYQEPMACFLLATILEAQGSSKNPEPFVKAYKYYKIALENGFVNALPKLLELGEKFAEFMEKAKNPPMSEEVKRMYL